MTEMLVDWWLFHLCLVDELELRKVLTCQLLPPTSTQWHNRARQGWPWVGLRVSTAWTLSG
jgi:hypothetical protein